LDNIAGPPVEGENFFGRGADVRRITELLRNHDVLLLGPRRIGKTSIARAVITGVRGKRWRAIEINVASSTDERGFLSKLETALTKEAHSTVRQLGEAFKDRLGAFASRIKSVKIPIPGMDTLDVGLGEANAEDWTQVAEDALHLMGGLDDPWLVYVDELPILLYNIINNDKDTGVQRVRRFLDWFRNDVRGLPSAGRVKWLISGSVGLDTLVQQHGMADTINSLKHATLPAFTVAEAHAMLRKLADDYQISLGETGATALLDAIQWYQPYYIQFIFDKLRSLIPAYPDTPLEELIDQAVELMAQPGEDNDFQFWEMRLSMQLPPPDAKYALFMLDQAAATREGVRPEHLLAALHERMPEATGDEAERTFRNLRDILLRDAYWIAQDSGGERRYRFLLEPLRRWWHRRRNIL
jgi:hypothetical protein